MGNPFLLLAALAAGLWLVVACAGHEYFVDGFGRVVDVKRPGAPS